MKLEVGQTVYLKPLGNMARRSQEIKEGVVAKIGRKYFTLENSFYGRFCLDSMFQDEGGYKCYTSLEEIEKEKEANLLHAKIHAYFTNNWNRELPLEKLKQIYDIINEDEE